MIVSAFITHKTGDLSTIILKRTPFTPAEVARYTKAAPSLPLVKTAWAPGAPTTTRSDFVAQLAGSSDAKAGALAANYPRDISAVSDDSPFFWHFVPFDERDQQHLPPAERAEPRGLHRRTGAAAPARRLGALRVPLPARTVLLRAQGVADAAGQGRLRGLLRRARPRLHVLRDHDDPAARAVPRVPDVFADRHARVDPRVHRARRAREQTARRPALADARAARGALRDHALLRDRHRQPHRLAARPGPRDPGHRLADRARPARVLPRHVHAARPEPRRQAERPRRRVHRVVVGRERVLLGHRLGAHHDPVDELRVQHRAVPRPRRLRGRRACVHPHRRGSETYARHRSRTSRTPAGTTCRR